MFSTRTSLKKCLKALTQKPLKGLTPILFVIFLSCAPPEPQYECVYRGNPFGIVDTIVTIAAVGDMMFARNVAARIAVAGYDAPLGDVASYLEKFDITTGNLECPVSHLGQPMDKKYVFRADPKIIPELVKSGFDAVCVANNHAFDYGLPCFLNTLERLRGSGIEPVGGGKNLAEALKPALLERNGLLIGILGFNYTRTNYIGEDKPACAPAEYWPRVFDAIRTARDSCDILLVHIHWGVEYAPYPADSQMILGRAMIDSGAAVVLGHHPHRWQGVEFYGGGLIAYSLGNFIFDQNDLANNVTGILELTFDKKRLSDVRVTPVELLTHPREAHFAKGAEWQIFEGILEESCLIFPTEIETTGTAIILRPIE